MQKIFVGIDVSKKKLDTYITGLSNYSVFDNTKSGYVKLVKVLKKVNPELILLESSGGYELPIAYKLLTEVFKVAIINPRMIRAFARAKGLHAKTDKIDSRLIAEYGEALKPEVVEIMSKEGRELKELVLRRGQIMNQITAEGNRLETLMSKFLRSDIKKHIKQLKRHLELVDKEIHRLIDNSLCWKKEKGFLTSIKGVGNVLASTLIAELPELGKLNRKEIAALVGVAPYNADSGKKTGMRFIKGGRKHLRNTLYMATVAAVRSNARIKAFYLKLKGKGKASKVALVACMRKFLILINALFKKEMLPAT